VDINLRNPSILYQRILQEETSEYITVGDISEDESKYD
jgi:hypothetical protein